MENYKISISNIEDHVEKIGVDVSPVIEHKMENTHLFDFYSQLVEKYPNMFDSLVQSATTFQVKKKFIFPGKGEADLATLSISQRGPVFVFPRKVGFFGEETDLGDTEKIVIECIKIFKKNFPTKVIRRLGQINEYIFALGTHNSIQFLANRFTKIKMSSDGEIRLRVNRPIDDYNRIIELQPVAKKKVGPQPYNREGDVVGYGLKVIVDFNNRDMSKSLETDDIRRIIQASVEFNEGLLYKFLNGGNND